MIIFPIPHNIIVEQPHHALSFLGWQEALDQKNENSTKYRNKQVLFFRMYHYIIVAWWAESDYMAYDNPGPQYQKGS